MPGGNAARALIPVGVLLITAAVYAPTLTFGFVSDDSRQIEMSRSRFTWDQIPSYFTSDVWSYAERRKGNYYRPVFLVWLLVNYQAFGLNHALWHASTVAAHLLGTLLLYLLARRLSGDRITAGIAALMFGLHPVHLEGVAWISGVTEPLSAVFSLAVLLCHFRWREEPDGRRRTAWRIAASIFFALAVFQKETAIVLPALLFVAEWLFPLGPAEAVGKRVRAGVIAVIPFLQVAVVYLGMRMLALGGFTPYAGEWPMATLVWTWPSAIWFYAHQLVWPSQLSLLHSLPFVAHPGWGSFAAPALAAAAAIFALIWIASRSRISMFALAIVILPLLPVLDLSAFSLQDFVHDRYLYLPSAGFCFLLALAFRRFASGWAPGAQVALVAVILALLAFQTLREERFWRDDSTMTARTMELAPESPVAQQYYAATLVLQERFAEALPLLQRSAEDHARQDPNLYYTIALCHLRLGQWDQAVSGFRKVIELTPDHPHAYLCLGMAELEQGKLAEAEADMREAIKLRPRVSVQYQGYHSTLGTLLERKGDLRGALVEYDAESRENQDAVWVLDRMVAVRAKLTSPVN